MENETVYSINEMRSNEARRISDCVKSSPQMQYISSLYAEFRIHFEERDLARMEAILNAMEAIDSRGTVLNIMHTAVNLLRGKGTKCYECLVRHIRNSSGTDTWVMCLVALWNFFQGELKLASEQFASLKIEDFSIDFMVHVMIFVAKIKKRLGFYEKSLDYCARLCKSPEGYRRILVIKLDLIHTYILKGMYDTAFDEIQLYLRYNDNQYIQRLLIYALYMTSNHDEILKHNKTSNIDPYTAYLIARIEIDNPGMYGIDPIYFLDEAIKGAGDNEYIFNTYGNYYYKLMRFSDAAEYYNMALAVNPKFEAPLKNLSTLSKISYDTDEEIYVLTEMVDAGFILADVIPDVEEIGFFDTWRLTGFGEFRVDRNVLRKAPLLNYLSHKR